MNADFHDACLRHLDDAERLFGDQRWANADHLFGLSAECGLKRLMLVFGMVFDQQRQRPMAKDDRVHANELWDRYDTYRSGRVSYGLGLTKPFHDWDVHQRYAHQNNFDQARVEPHRAAARQVRDLLRQADRDGLL